MRIDKLLCEMNLGSRSQVKEFLKKGFIKADGEMVKNPDAKVDETKVVITYKGKSYQYHPFVYFMMNKPQGFISATTDTKDRTVLDLFKQRIKESNCGELTGIPIKDIFPVGRLDKDTVGLLLLTNNGELAHRLLSPERHVQKKYYVETNGEMTNETVLILEQGVCIGTDEYTRPSIVEKITGQSCYITITEGKYHQVKRMFEATGLKVTFLKRISMGSLVLDEALAEGQIRRLTEKEVNSLCSKI